MQNYGIAVHIYVKYQFLRIKFLTIADLILHLQYGKHQEIF